MRLCGNALTQLVIPAALVDSESTHEMLVPGGRLYEQRRATCEGLDKIEGVSYIPNKAAFYLFPKLEKEMFDFESAEDFAMKFLHESHIICGFRCGWMVFSGPKGELDEIKDGVMKLASMRLCGNALTQLVIPAALVDSESTQEMLIPGGRLFEQRRATTEGLDKIEGVSYIENKAAFYLFPALDQKLFDFENAQDFAMKFLHEYHVLVIPGNGFDWNEDLRFRIVMLPEPEVLTKAMNDLKHFLNHHRV